MVSLDSVSSSDRTLAGSGNICSGSASSIPFLLFAGVKSLYEAPKELAQGFERAA